MIIFLCQITFIKYSNFEKKTPRSDSKIIGKVTSAVYSPRLNKNIALAMVDINYSVIGMEIEVSIEDKIFKCEVIEKPFFDPKKHITSKSL